MGMDVGSTKGPKSEMNVVPLIDVLLVLLVIFMVIVPHISVGLPAYAPAEDHGPPRYTEGPQPKPIVVRVFADGSLLLNQEPATWERLPVRLAEIFKFRAERVAFVQGEDAVEFRQVARALDLMRRAGVDHVGLLSAARFPLAD